MFESNFKNNFKVSYTSSNTFFENKHGFSENDLNRTVPTVILKNNKVQIPNGFYQNLVSGLLTENRFSFNVQLRTFKTDRNIKAELLRNPPLTDRVKNVLGVSGD